MSENERLVRVRDGLQVDIPWGKVKGYGYRQPSFDDAVEVSRQVIEPIRREAFRRSDMAVRIRCEKILRQLDKLDIAIRASVEAERYMS